MIDPNWRLVDLDPRTWRNIGRFFNPGQYIQATRPGTHCLFVLHDNGKLKNIVDNQRPVSPDLKIARVDDPQALAQSLYDRGEWQQVHVINKRHLAEVSRIAQAEPHRELTLDQYYRKIYHLLWDDSKGYVTVPPRTGNWHGWTYQDVENFVKSLPVDATLALGVFNHHAVEIGLILELHNGVVTLVTTFEALQLEPGTAQLSPEFCDQLWSQLGEKFAPPAAILLCTQVAFESWLNADDKLASLNEAAAQGTALWKLTT